jgi:hypothetical protein
MNVTAPVQASQSAVSLDEIYQDLKLICNSTETCFLPVDIALKFVHRILPVLRDEEEERGWYILWAVCSPMVNGLSIPFRQAFEHAPECDAVLHLIPNLFRAAPMATNGQDKIYGLRFLAEFMMVGVAKSAIFFESPDVLRGIIGAVEREVKEMAQDATRNHLDCNYAIQALTCAAYAILPIYTGGGSDVRHDFAEIFLSCNGLHALSLAFDHCAKHYDRLKIIGEGRSPYLERCAKSLGLLFSALGAWQPTHLDETLYVFSADARTRFNATAHILLNLSLPAIPRENVFRAIFGYIYYVSTSNGSQAVEDCLLFKPDEASLPLVVLQMLAMHSFNEVKLEVAFRVTLQDWAEGMPAVAAALHQHKALFPTAKDDKPRQCALPTCQVSSAWLVSTMKKCGRCKAVYYCGAAHQKEHWSVHKRECMKAEC